MTYSTFSVQLDSDGIALLTIDLPGETMNVWNEALITEFERFVDDFTGNDAMKGAVIASGKANGFLAGADIRMLQGWKGGLSAEGYEQAARLSRLLRKMENGGHTAKEIAKEGAMAKPVACALEGLALGGGLELALACHYRVAADSPKVQLGVPEVQIGLLPGAGGTQRLPRLMGLQAAAMMITQGKPVKAAQAMAQGVVHELVEPGKAVDAAKAWVRANPKVLAPWDQKGFKFPGGAGAMNPAGVQFYIGGNAMALGQSRDNYPAIRAIMSCLYEGSNLPFDPALDIEVKYFLTLLAGPVSKNMIRSLFVNKQAMDKGAARPKDVPPLEIRTLGVLGAGLMGSGITHVSVKGGMDVIVLDRTAEDAAKAVAYSKRILDKDVARGKTTQEQADAFLARITPTTDYAELAKVDLVIEAVFELPEVKKGVIEQAEAAIRPEVVFASNTSTIPIGNLAKFSSRPDRFIGMHFFSPVERMPLLEIIPHKGTGDVALAAAFDYNRKIRKTPIVVEDVRGFYTNQVVPPYLGEAAHMVMEGVSPVLIENCARNLGMPVGPLALMDETTLKLGKDIMDSAKQELGDAYQPTGLEPFYDLMVDDLGRSGRRFGKGFYEYAEDGKKLGLWKGMADHYPPAAPQPSPEAVEERLLYGQLVPAARCYAEGVVHDPQSADLGAIFGWGFPPYTGGPISYIDMVGIAKFVEVADRLAAEHGPRFEVPAMYREMATKGGTLYAAA
ncbi:MAG: 3-hydroxyacyl-CoA dehydrogenase NAD-binding domain-containing protein [Sphingomonadaceae bacterium]